MSQTTWKRSVSLLALLAVPALVPALMHDEFSAPHTLDACGHFKAVLLADPALFSIAGLTGKDGSPLHGGHAFSQIEGARTCGLLDRPMSFHGHTALPESANVWALSTSDTGQHYLIPRALIKAGEWIAPDLAMGSNIVRITFLQVDTETDRAYRARVAKEDWWELPWPVGAKELATLTYEKEHAK